MDSPRVKLLKRRVYDTAIKLSIAKKDSRFTKCLARLGKRFKELHKEQAKMSLKKEQKDD